MAGRNAANFTNDVFGYNKSMTEVHRLFLAAVNSDYSFVWLALIIYASGFQEWVVKFTHAETVFAALDIPAATEGQLKNGQNNVTVGKNKLRLHYDNVTNVRVKITPDRTSKTAEYTVHHPSFAPNQAQHLPRLVKSQKQKR